MFKDWIWQEQIFGWMNLRPTDPSTINENTPLDTLLVLSKRNKLWLKLCLLLKCDYKWLIGLCLPRYVFIWKVCNCYGNVVCVIWGLITEWECCLQLVWHMFAIFLGTGICEKRGNHFSKTCFLIILEWIPKLIVYLMPNPSRHIKKICNTELVRDVL